MLYFISRFLLLLLSEGMWREIQTDILGKKHAFKFAQFRHSCFVLINYVTCEPNGVNYTSWNGASGSIVCPTYNSTKLQFYKAIFITPKQDGGSHKLYLFILKPKQYVGAEQLGPDVFHHIWNAVLGEIPQLKDTAGGTSLRSRPWQIVLVECKNSTQLQCNAQQVPTSLKSGNREEAEPPVKFAEGKW